MTREDIHAGIEAQLIADAGSDAGGRMHLGRSRNDEVATCLRMRTRELLIDTLTALFELRQSLISRAEEHTTTIMPGFTHLQHAQPTTLAHRRRGSADMSFSSISKQIGAGKRRSRS